MKLWKRAAGILKDKNSILVATLSLSGRSNPDLETAIIKATSHDEFHVDYRNAQRVFTWIRTSPVSFKPLISALSKRMDKTTSWVVALKGLILIHGVFCCNTPAVHNIGRLPFDLSHFCDGHLRPSNSWGFNNLVRSYYSYLDQRSTFLYEREQTNPSIDPTLQDLVKLQEWQSLLDLLLQIKPRASNMKVTLIIEAMDCVIIEMYDVYSRICSGIARLLMRIHSAGKLQVSMALRVIQKAIQQSQQLSLYFEFCSDFGVLNMVELPKVIQIPEEDIRDLERIINGVTEKNKMENEGALTTIITDKWEVFKEDFNNQFLDNTNRNVDARNPFSDPPNLIIPYNHHHLPDLIIF